MMSFLYNKMMAMAVLLIFVSMLASAYNAGVKDGGKAAFKKGFVVGHEKRLMKDMKDICI